MTELENTIDIDCFNDEQWLEQSYDCLEYGQHLMETGKIDLSDQLYEQYREEKAEKENQFVIENKDLYLN